MKFGFTIAIAIIALFSSCSSQEEKVTLTSPQMSDVKIIRSYDDALKIAESSISLLNGSAVTTRSGSPRVIDMDKSKVFKNTAKTRSGSYNNDTLIYVFNFNDNKGFALVSASLETEGLLAITEQGYCDPDTLSGIFGFDQFVEKAKEYVASSRNNRFPPDSTLVFYKEVIVPNSYDYVGPYVTVRWGQEYTEGTFCSNNMAGCVNTAIAQVLSYYEYPSAIDLTYPGCGQTYQTLNWTSMKSHTTKHNLNNCTDIISHNATGRFLRQLGELTNSQYNPGVTITAFDLYGVSTLTTLGYTVGTSMAYNGATARYEIDNNHLFIVDNYNHTWVFDGYLIEDATIEYYERPYNSSLWLLYDTEPITIYYNHFNWGWHGDNNGYFNENVYNVNSVVFPDTQNNNRNGDYSDYVHMRSVYHIVN